MVSNMATTHCLPITDSGSQGTVKGRRTRSSRLNSNDSEPFTSVALKYTTCPGTPSTDSFGSKVSTSTPASSTSLNENVSRNQPKPQVIKRCENSPSQFKHAFQLKIWSNVYPVLLYFTMLYQQLL